MVNKELINPHDYLGCAKHPSEDNKLRQIKRATIKESTGPAGGFDLHIYFEDGKQFYDWSKTERGAKQIFAFQSYAGSRWKQIKN